MYISSTRKSLSPALRPHLPKESNNEQSTASDLARACQNYVSDVRSGRTPSVDPYSDKLSGREKVALSQGLQQVATQAASDFAAQPETRGATLGLGQLGSSLGALQSATEREISQLNGEKKSLKSGYRKQVAKTVGWMAGTAGALVVGGLVPNPLSVLGVGFMATMTVRSIGKARAAQKNLAQQLPQIKQNLAAASQVLGQTVAYGPAVAAWSQALRHEGAAAA